MSVIVTTGPIGPQGFQGDLGPQGPFGVGTQGPAGPTGGIQFPYDVTTGDATFINVGGPLGSVVINSNGFEINGLNGTTFPSIIISNVGTSASYAIDIDNIIGASAGLHIGSNVKTIFDGPVNFTGIVTGVTAGAGYGATGPQGPQGPQGSGVQGQVGPTGPSTGFPYDILVSGPADFVNVGNGYGSFNLHGNGIAINNIISSDYAAIQISGVTGSSYSIHSDATNAPWLIEHDVTFTGRVYTPLYINDGIEVDMIDGGDNIGILYDQITSASSSGILYSNVTGASHGIWIDNTVQDLQIDTIVNFGGTVNFTGIVTGVSGSSQNLQQVTEIGALTNRAISIIQSGTGSIILDPTVGISVTGASANSSTTTLTTTGAYQYVTSADGNNIVGFIADDNTNVTQLAFLNSGNQLTINSASLSTARIQQFQDGDGVLAFLSDITGTTLQTVLDNGNSASQSMILTSTDTFHQSIQMYPDAGISIFGASSNVISLNCEPTGAVVQLTSVNNNNSIELVADDDKNQTTLNYLNNSNQLQINSATLSASRTQQFQNANGTIALLSDIPAPGILAYTVSGTHSFVNGNNTFYDDVIFDSSATFDGISTFNDTSTFNGNVSLQGATLTLDSTFVNSSSSLWKLINTMTINSLVGAQLVFGSGLYNTQFNAPVVFGATVSIGANITLTASNVIVDGNALSLRNSTIAVNSPNVAINGPLLGGYGNLSFIDWHSNNTTAPIRYNLITGGSASAGIEYVSVTGLSYSIMVDPACSPVALLSGVVVGSTSSFNGKNTFNSTTGTTALIAGSATVSNVYVTTNSLIWVNYRSGTTISGSRGNIQVNAQTNGSFNISSYSFTTGLLVATDTNTVQYWIIN